MYVERMCRASTKKVPILHRAHHVEDAVIEAWTVVHVQIVTVPEA
jgi:hypothetical protein